MTNTHEISHCLTLSADSGKRSPKDDATARRTRFGRSPDGVAFPSSSLNRSGAEKRNLCSATFCRQKPSRNGTINRLESTLSLPRYGMTFNAKLACCIRDVSRAR